MDDALNRLFKDFKPFLNVKEVSLLMGVTNQAVYSWLREGVIPGYKIGKTWFVSRDELKEVMRAGSNKNTKTQGAISS